MLKKVVILKCGDKPIDIIEVKEVTPAEYYTIKKECDKNREDREKSQEERITKCESDIKLLKGEISTKEYEELCRGK